MRLPGSKLFAAVYRVRDVYTASDFLIGYLRKQPVRLSKQTIESQYGDRYSRERLRQRSAMGHIQPSNLSDGTRTYWPLDIATFSKRAFHHDCFVSCTRFC
jgi:hypothetical protein